MTPDYKAFARWAIQNSAFAGGSLDGGGVQDMAVEMGLLVPVKCEDANRARWERIGGGCLEIGDTFYVFVEDA